MSGDWLGYISKIELKSWPPLQQVNVVSGIKIIWCNNHLEPWNTKCIFILQTFVTHPYEFCRQALCAHQKQIITILHVSTSFCQARITGTCLNLFGLFYFSSADFAPTDFLQNIFYGQKILFLTSRAEEFYSKTIEELTN